MTRYTPFFRLNPQRRSSGFAALFAAAAVSSSCALTSGQMASAQSHDGSQEIRQVAGNGLLGGLFGRDSDESEEPYRKATPVPSDREVNWSGIPFHNPQDGQTAGNSKAPIRDPGANYRAARSAPAPRSVPSRTRSAVPTPPPIASSTPRKLTDSRDSGTSTTLSSSGRPTPLSVTQSSRRAPSLQPKAVVRRLESNPPVPAAAPSRSAVAVDVRPVELVPKVSRKVIKSVPRSPSAVVAKLADKPANEDIAKKVDESAVHGGTLTDDEPSQKVAAQSDAPRVAQQSVAKPTPAAPAATPAPVNEASTATKVAAAEPAQDPTPAKQPAATPAESTQVAKSSPAPAPTPASPEVASPEVDAQPQTEQVAKSSVASLGTPTLALPADDTETKSASVPRMTTFGNSHDGDRASSSLTASAQSGIALQPISDRLPVDGMEAPTTPQNGLPESHLAGSSDSFAPRAQTAAGMTTPNYHPTGYGLNGMPPISETNLANNSRGETTGPRSSAPRSSQNPQSAPHAQPATTPQVNGQSNSAVNVTANSNASATELPGIRVITSGPRQVMIRQTHSYEIRVENRGSIDAKGLTVRAHIPDWADVVGQQASHGDVAAATEEQVRNLNWKIDHLNAGQSETLNVRLKAARSGTHDLDVDWTLAPQKRVVRVTVQEPELALTIDGPDEVVFGESKTYQIRVLNAGDGIAPDVVFTLSPDSNSPQSQRIGDIPAGKEAQFEVELTAQDLGELKIHGIAVGDLELKAAADKTVRVLAAELEAVLAGPEVKYQDTEAVYQLELANRGKTASENVVATLQLPVGVTYQGGMEGATMIDNQLRWKIASLPAGAVRNYQFHCNMDTTGKHQFAFQCEGSAAGKTSVNIDTNVEAIADLVLSVVDPTAPAPVGEEVAYEVVIRNRGSKPAMDVQAVAQFSSGIEPKTISGLAGKVVTGQVLVDPIARIDAGEEVRMTIVAKAESGGHHRFRTEVRSGDTVLVAEEATHYLAPKTQRITRRSGPQAEQADQPVR
ncbi:COG1361 family protein [Allorhodopirellula solitaria]|uniref:Large cysteine-rich periplasmic protein OmcB n=1 Tax=Allorhodopirellula solitaria TaxID=2527987 RepID=A0A5C5YJR6_9BACT|nr:DUF11 domain-containing protein [Allorhodopirellula solitaria]TWT75067.1 Large cysteine-rich periplasmic protein OmcB precursor [Allorhodopirellula solitaria]